MVVLADNNNSFNCTGRHGFNFHVLLILASFSSSIFSGHLFQFKKSHNAKKTCSNKSVASNKLELYFVLNQQNKTVEGSQEKIVCVRAG